MRRGLSRHSNKSSGNFFSPLSLFAGGVDGVWYDPSDASTLFEDTAGTTPCRTPGATVDAISVGLMLDKSQGLALGSELITNGGPFVNTTGWTAFNSTLSVVLGALRVTENGVTTNPYAQQSFAVTSGKWYKVTFDLVTLNAQKIKVWVGSSYGSANWLNSPDITTTGSKTVYFLAAGSTAFFEFVGYTTAGGTSEYYDVNYVSVKELAGNHAISYNTTTARPELSARVNLLTYSENLNGTGWSTLFGGTGTTPTITSNYATAPDGTVTASRFVGTRGASNTTADYSLSVSPNGTVSSGASYVGSVYIKSNTGSNQNVTLYVNTGAAVQQIVAVAGSTWTRVAPAALTATTTTCNIVIGTRGGSYGGDQSLDILVWGADLRPANIGTSVPAYQRIADQYTYDSSGFPRYLKFDGIDDGMYTPANLNLSATDKATVFAGVRKLSDATYPTITELSASAALNLGTFAIYAGGTANAPQYPVYLLGTTTTGYEPGTYTAPISNVLTVSFDIGGAARSNEIVPRINGVLSQTNPVGTANAGTGNFGTYPLNIGVRNAQGGAPTTFFFNGYIYSLIVVGAASTAAQISSTESWINVKEGTVY